MYDRANASARPDGRPRRPRAGADAFGLVRAWPLLVALLLLVPRADLLPEAPRVAHASTLSSAVAEGPETSAAVHTGSGREARPSARGWGRTPLSPAPGATDATSDPLPVVRGPRLSTSLRGLPASPAPGAPPSRTDLAAGFLTDHALAPPILL